MLHRFFKYEVLEAPDAIRERVAQKCSDLVETAYLRSPTVLEVLKREFPAEVGRVRIQLSNASGEYKFIWDNCNLTHFESVSDVVHMYGGFLAADTIGGWHVTLEPVPADFFTTGGRLKDLAGYPASEVQLAEIYSHIRERVENLKSKVE